MSVVVTAVDLTDWQPLDLVFTRGETVSFRVTFSNVTAETVAGWDITCTVRRAARLEPFCEWAVLVTGTAVVFTLGEAWTEILPDHADWSMRIAWPPSTVRIPLGGKLLPRSRAC